MAEYLSNDEKRNLIQTNLKQFATDAFQHDLNRKIAIAAEDTEAVVVAEDAIVVIENAISMYEQELDILVSPEPTI